MLISVSVVVPLVEPAGWLPQGAMSPDRFPLLIAQVCGLSGGLKLTPGWDSVSDISVTKLESTSEFPAFEALWRPHPFRRYTLLKFATMAEVDIHEYRETLLRNNPRLENIEVDQAVAWAGDVTATDLSQVVGALFMACHIAYPGVAESAKRMLFAGDVYIREDSSLASDLSLSVAKARELGWPPIVEVPLAEVWQWLSNVPGLTEGTPHRPAGRAISAFSHLLSGQHTTSPAMGMLWALIGLEALYAKGHEGLKSQLLEKSEVVLGPRLAHKKVFGRMYDFRSRFVHGDLDLPLAYDDNFAPEPGNFESDAIDAENVAVAMLIASLQQLVVMQLYEFRFSYSLRSTPLSS
jgi:hypothetical protein